MSWRQRGHPAAELAVGGAERTDDQFLEALATADVDALDALLADDFLIVDVFAGSIADRHALIESVGSDLLDFGAIEVVERATRRYGDIAVVVGRTRMAGSFEGAGFEVASRYTHVLRHAAGGSWQLVNAQGTQVIDQVPRSDVW